MGQPILLRETLPAFVAILYEGQASAGYAPQTKVPETLQLLQPGAVLGCRIDNGSRLRNRDRLH